MRPSSIRTFEMLYWISILLTVVGAPLSFAGAIDVTRAYMGNGPGSDTIVNMTIAWQSLMMVVILIFGVIVPAVFCVLAARKGSNVARWFIVAGGVIGLLVLIYRLWLAVWTIADMPQAPLFWAAVGTGVLAGLFHMASLPFLFTGGATLWFGGQPGDAPPAAVPPAAA